MGEKQTGAWCVSAVPYDDREDVVQLEYYHDYCSDNNIAAIKTWEMKARPLSLTGINHAWSPINPNQTSDPALGQASCQNKSSHRLKLQKVARI